MTLSLLIPAEEIELQPLLDRLQGAPVLRPFAPELLAFIDALSHELLHTPGVRAYPELVALGYWFRPAQLKQLQQSFTSRAGAQAVRARGLVFHITPANVDTIFVYSWLLSCLAGNSNILRLSTTERPVMRGLLDIVREVLARPAFAWMRSRIAIVRYGHDDAISSAISARCAMRVIWGGDATVNHMRSLPLPPRATELTFADRVSFTVMDAAAVLSCPTLPTLASRFLSDLSTFEQMACSSPRALFWIGDAATTAAAQLRFWAEVTAQAAQQDSPLHEAAAGLQRLSNAMGYAISHEVQAVPVNQLLQLPARLTLQHWSTHSLHSHEGHGLVLEGRMDSLTGLGAIVDARVQTVSAFGIAEAALYEWVMSLPSGAVDRVVAIGSALDFAAVWDGNDLLQQFTHITTLPRVRS